MMFIRKALALVSLVALASLAALVIYMGFAFVTLEMNPAQWGRPFRQIALLTYPFVFLPLVVANQCRR